MYLYMCNDHTTFTPPQAFSPVFVFCFAQNSYFTSRARQDTKYKCIWLTLSTYCPSRLTRKRGGVLLQIYSNSDILRIMEYPPLIRPTFTPCSLRVVLLYLLSDTSCSRYRGWTVVSKRKDVEYSRRLLLHVWRFETAKLDEGELGPCKCHL